MGFLGRCLVCVVLTLHILVVLGGVDACTSLCTCTTIPAKAKDGLTSTGNSEVGEGANKEMPQTTRGRKVNCSSNPYPISSIEDINEVTTIPLDTIQLDLSKNAIAVIPRGSFNGLSDLQKLDFSNNQIREIEPGAFEGLQNLERLDLSHNKLGSINASIFSGMPKLQKLSLSFNKFNTIPEGTFNDLPSLRRIDFDSEFLRCDCHLSWIVKWSKDKKVRITPSTTCAVPRELKGTPLRSLKRKDLHCDRPLELPLFEIMPSKSQIVFEGDKLPFECRASVIDDHTQMYWLRQGEVVKTNRSAGVIVFTQKSPDPSLILHSLVLEDLRAPHSGVWQCLVSTPQGNVSKSVSIKVLATDATDCPEVTTKTDKGIYMWKVTVAGVQQLQPCKVGQGVVTHSCSESGHWINLNNSQCDFINELTRRLQTLGMKDTNSTKDLAENLKRDVTATFGGVNNTLIEINAVNVDLAAKAIERVSKHAAKSEEIVTAVLYSASVVMNIQTSILYEAQRQKKACTRIFQAVEQIPHLVSPNKKFSKTSDFIVLEVFSVPTRQFSGVECSRLDLALDPNIYQMVQKGSSHIFVCGPVSPNNTESAAYQKLPELTSIHIPQTVVRHQNSSSVSSGTTTVTSKTVQFQFIWYQNANLFQVVTKSDSDPVLGNREWKPISGVISASLSVVAENLTDPIVLKFEIPETEKRVVAAYWHLNPDSGYGEWRTDGCRVAERKKTTVTAHCNHLSAFTILEDQSKPERAMFHMLEIIVYVGSCVCLLCLMAVVITYVSCYRFLNVPKKMKHSVINICISITLLIIGFTMGIKRTDHELACQVVGIGIHYLTLVVLFWITVSANNMLKKFCKAEKPPPPPVDLPMPLPPKPMLRFYLLAWGVPIIICGITAAVSFEFYDEQDYCFLEWEPGVGAFIGPVGFLVLLNLFFFLRISCVIRSSTGPLLSLEETEELPINDIELTQNHENSRIETGSIHSNMSSKSSVSSVMDFEKRPISQLRALVAILFFFLVTWVSGALSVATPFKSIIVKQQLIFSYVYGVFSAILGLFMLTYYCLSRKDSRTSWKRFFLCEQQNVYDMNRDIPNHMPHANGHVNTGSGTDVSTCNKVTNPVSSSNPAVVVKSGPPPKVAKLNIVPSQPASSVTDESVNNSGQENAASFYNPRQNGVAKKFWDKKNKHNSKLLSKEMVKSLNMSGSQNEMTSGGEGQRRHSQGYSSDANTHLSIEIKIQANNPEQGKDGHLPQSPTETNGAPPSYTSVISNNMTMYPNITGNGHASSPIGRRVSPSAPEMEDVFGSPQVTPQHNRTSSSSSLGRNHLSAFAVVPPRNNTLPRQGKNLASSPSSPERELPETNSSVPRMSDFDGQSQVSSSCSHEKHRSPIAPPDQSPFMPGYGPPALDGYMNRTPMFKQYGLIDANPPPSLPSFSPAQRSRTNSGGYSSDNSSRFHHRKLENNFVQQVEQRIPQDNKLSPVTHKPPLSPASDSDSMRHRTPADSDSQIHYRKQKFNDSDHNSEPTSQSHRKHGRARDSHKHRGMVKQRSLDWEDEFKDKPSPQVIPYAYVNHNYTDKVLQKLQTRAMVENVDPTSKAFWVPRSSSSYNEIVHEENTRLCEDDSSTSSSDDDSIDNIWVLQKERKRKKDDKKETSV